MSFLDGVRHQLRALTGARQYARELNEEMQFHLSLDAMQREHAARGSLSSDDARFAARRRFGNLTSLTEETRAMAGLSLLDEMMQDARFALRTFRRAPAFTSVAVLTLAIGIGANTAIFSAVNALLLRPLPFPNPERLMRVGLIVPSRNGAPPIMDMVWSYPKFVVFRDAQHLFAEVALYAEDEVTIRIAGEAERVRQESAGARYLSVLGVHPAIGRNFTTDEDAHPGGPRVAMLSDELWKRRYNADPQILGKFIEVSGNPYEIVGVLPQGFRGLSGRAELWTSLMSHPADELGEAYMHGFTLLSRLAPGVTAERAKALMPGLGALVDRAYPDGDRADNHWGAMARELDAVRVDPMVRRSILILLAAVGLVLLIACANVANLFLVRAAGRRREIAVRLAVGAGRGRLIRQLLTESIVLAFAGGAAGVLIAWWGVKLLGALDPANVLRVSRDGGLGAVSLQSIHLDARALLFAVIVSLATGILFGLVPALQFTQPALSDALKEEKGSRAGVESRRFTSRNVLVVAEIALAIILLAGSGLMLRSLQKLLHVDPGFEAGHTLTMRFNSGIDARDDSLFSFYDDVLTRMRELPGVTGAELIDCPPLNGGCNGTLIEFRDRPPVTMGTQPEVGVHWVTPGWLALMHVKLLRGRGFSREDRSGVQKVVLVNARAARQFWPGQDPIGRPVSVLQGGFDRDTALVVGVVGDVRFGTLDSSATPDVYLSYYQSPRARMMMMLRTDGDERALVTPARRIVHALAPASPVYDVRSMRERAADATRYARFSTIILALFGIVALALATMGTYGVISFGVAQRTREIGIRVALGAQHASLMRMIVSQGLALALIGGAIGLVAALAATRVLRSLLFEIVPGDPLTFAAILVVLGVAVLAASWIPARRAATVHPSEALREG
jgi:putative ABC transport system permease protein